jgi:hypothetical protein
MSQSEFSTGMQRTVAVLCIAAGLVLVGIALGLIYLDVRGHVALELAASAGLMNQEALEQWHEPTPILIALVCGALGAGLTGAGALLGLFELAAFWRASSR